MVDTETAARAWLNEKANISEAASNPAVTVRGAISVDGANAPSGTVITMTEKNASGTPSVFNRTISGTAAGTYSVFGVAKNKTYVVSVSDGSDDYLVTSGDEIVVLAADIFNADIVAVTV
jgi:hypothetical protein